MPSGMESFLTGFAKQSTKGVEKISDSFSKLFLDNYKYKLKSQIPEYEYRNVKGIGLVYVNKQDPNDVRVAIPEVPEEDKKLALTGDKVRSIGISGGFARDEDEPTLLQFGIPPERIIKQDKGIMVIGEKQVQEDNKQKVNVFEKVASDVSKEIYFAGSGELWHKVRFQEGELGGPKYPVEVIVEEFNKIKDVKGVDPTNAIYTDYLGKSKVFTTKVINYQIKDVLDTSSFTQKKAWWKIGREGTEDVNCLKFIKSNLGNVEESDITPELIRNQYEELKKSGTIKSVDNVEELLKKEKELMKLSYSGLTQPTVTQTIRKSNKPTVDEIKGLQQELLDRNLPEITDISELEDKEPGFEFMRGGQKYKIVSFDKNGEALLDEVK